MTTAEAKIDEGRAERWFGRVPVRLRITVAVVILSGLALAGAGLAVFLLQEQRLDDAVNESIARELRRFEALQSSGDPGVNGTARRLLLSALASTAGDPAESVIVFWDDQPQRLLEADLHKELFSDPEFIAGVNAVGPDGGVDEIGSVIGPLRVAVKPVRDERTDGAIVYAYSLDEIAAQLRQTIQTYAFVASVSLLVVGLGAYVVSGRLLSPIRQLKETAREISDSDLTRRIAATGNDDLTDLTMTFNEMLDRLQAAFSTQRQFLDDVGHELKTPLTIVRGHLELMVRDDPGDVAATRALVLEEVDRMGRLVEELILLAKARRPDFLSVEEVDAGALTDILLEKMRGLGPRKWRVDARAEGVVRVDAQRLTQAMLQLAANAVVHTASGSVIAVGSRVSGGRVSWWVSDQGPGIPAAVHDQIFERFRRGDDKGDGSGLGLAIVRAIAQAHGGDVAVNSAPGMGARFTITIPRHGAAGEDRQARHGWPRDPLEEPTGRASIATVQEPTW
jgi:signal transduction histidine kinase